MKYLQLILTTLLFFLFSTILLSQELKEDVVYLKNGAIYRGQILENKINEYVKIEIIGHNVFVVEYDEILNITSEAQLVNERFKPLKENGFQSKVNFNVLFGNYLESSIKASFGYKFNSHYTTGLGIGYDFTDYGYIPLFADFTYDYKNENFSPFFNFQVGYEAIGNNYSWRDYKGGFYLEPNIGLKIRSGNHASFLLNAGYRHQQIYYDEQWWGTGDIVNVRLVMNRFMFGIGYLFY